MVTSTKPKERITATEARVHFGELYRRVTENDETIVIERNGKPGAVILSIGAFEALGGRGAESGVSTESDMPSWYLEMVKVATAYREAHEGEQMRDGVDLVRESREERDAELLERLSGR